jgi:hypothetical protein
MMCITYTTNITQSILECTSVVEHFVDHTTVEKSLECSINSNAVVRSSDLLFDIGIT